MVDQSSGPSVRRMISSRLTFLFKFLFSGIWIAGFGTATATLWIGATGAVRGPADAALKWIFLLGWLAGSTFIAWLIAPIKRVQMDQAGLYVSNYVREIVLAYDDIEDVSENRWINLHPVTLKLRRDTAFGRSIRFLPRLAPFRWFSAQPIVAELRMRARLVDPLRPWPEPPGPLSR